jgi:hypothetical protein
MQIEFSRQWLGCLLQTVLWVSLALPLTSQTPAPASLPPANVPAAKPAGNITNLFPKVRLTRAKAKFDVQVNDPLFLQDLLQTEKKARARLLLLDGSQVNLGPRTRFIVAEMSEQSQQSHLLLVAGRLRAEIAKRTNPQGRFTVQTRTAVIGAIGTEEFVAAFPEETIVANLSDDPNSLLWVRSSDPKIDVVVFVRPGYGTRVPLGNPPTPPRVWGEKELERARDDSREFGRYDANFDRDYPNGFPYVDGSYPSYSGFDYDDRGGSNRGSGSSNSGKGSSNSGKGGGKGPG